MNMYDKLREALGQMKGKFHFKADFEDRAMRSIRIAKNEKTTYIKRWSNRGLLMAAASVAILLLSTYLSEGTINGDALIGLEGFNSIDLKESLDTYVNIYHE